MKTYWKIWSVSCLLVPTLYYIAFVRWMERHLMESAKGMTVLPTRIQDVPGWGTVEAVGTYVPAAYLMILSVVLMTAGARFEAKRASQVTLGTLWGAWLLAWAMGY